MIVECKSLFLDYFVVIELLSLEKFDLFFKLEYLEFVFVELVDGGLFLEELSLFVMLSGFVELLVLEMSYLGEAIRLGFVFVAS